MELDTVVEQYRQYLKAKAKSSGTIRAYCSDVKWFIHKFSLGDHCDIQDLTAEAIQSHLVKFKYNTQVRRLAGLRSFFLFLSREGYTDHFILQYPERNRDDSIHTHILHDEYQAMRNAAFPRKSGGPPPKIERNLALFDLLYGSGLKIKTASNLRFSQVDFQSQKLYGLEGYVVDLLLTEESQKSLKIHCDISNLSENDPIFKNRFGKPLGLRSSRKIIKTYGNLIDKDISPEDLRWSYFINLVQKGISYDEIIDLMGYHPINQNSRDGRKNVLKKRFLRFQQQQLLLTQGKT